MANVFETYVKNNPDLGAAYEAYKDSQNSGAVDSWEVAGINQGVGGMTAEHPGTQMSMAQFGHTHYAQYGQEEGRPLESDASDAGGDGGDTALPLSPSGYRPDVDIASSTEKTFYGTNIPTAGYSAEQIKHYNDRMREALDIDKNSRIANDVLFSIAYAKKGVGVAQGESEGFGQGNESVGAVQSGMYKLDSGPLWGEQYINSTNDRYQVRDEQGVPTGQFIRYSDDTGVQIGSEGNWVSTGSWGGNAKAGIIEGQPTTTPPAKGLISTGIRDLDEGGFFATGKAGVETGIGAGVGDLISQIPYTQPASPNFSEIMPSVNYSPQFEALTSGQGKFFAPWSEGQATPSGLLDYQIPGGDLANVAYTGGNTSLFNTDTSGSAFSSGNTTTDASGGKWIMTSDGQWIPATSDYGEVLTSGSPSKYPAGHYDSNGMWIGAEGPGTIDPRITVNLPSNTSGFSTQPYTGSAQPFTNT